MARFLLIAFFLSACASGRLHYVNKPYQRDVVSTAQHTNESNTQDEYENVQSDRPEESPNIDNEEDQMPVKQKTVNPTFTNRLIKRVELNYADDIPELKPQLEKLKQMRSENLPEEKSEREQAGFVLLIVGLILAILSIFFFLKAENVSSNSGTVDGCAQSIMDSFMYFVWGMIIGIGGVLLILIGAIFIITSRNNGAEQPSNSTGE